MEYVYFFHPPEKKSTGSVSKTSKATKLGENKFYATTKDSFLGVKLTKADMTLPRAESERLIFVASFSRSP